MTTQRRPLVAHNKIALHLAFTCPHHIHTTEISRYPTRTDCGVPGGVHPRSENVQGIIVQPVAVPMGKVLMPCAEMQSAGARRASTLAIYPCEVRASAVHPALVH